MKRLEIVHLRSYGGLPDSVVSRVRALADAPGDNAKVVTLYYRVGLETDLALHVHIDRAPECDGASALGLHLASELRAFGLVVHTLWREAP